MTENSMRSEKERLNVKLTYDDVIVADEQDVSMCPHSEPDENRDD